MPDIWLVMSMAVPQKTEREGGGVIEMLTDKDRDQLKATGHKQYICECGNEFWYLPGQVTVCGRCFRVIQEIDGKIEKAFES